MHTFAAVYQDGLWRGDSTVLHRQTQGWPGVPGSTGTRGHSGTGLVTANPPENPSLFFLEEPQNREGKCSATHIYPIRKFLSSRV